MDEVQEDWLEILTKKQYNEFEQLKIELEKVKQERGALVNWVAMFTLDDLQGMFNHYMEMQKQAIHGQSGEFTVNFWKESARKQLGIIRAYKDLPEATRKEIESDDPA